MRSEGLPNQLNDGGNKSMQWKCRRWKARHWMPMDAKWVGAAWEVSRCQSNCRADGMSTPANNNRAAIAAPAAPRSFVRYVVPMSSKEEDQEVVDRVISPPLAWNDHPIDVLLFLLNSSCPFFFFIIHFLCVINLY